LTSKVDLGESKSYWNDLGAYKVDNGLGICTHIYGLVQKGDAFWGGHVQSDIFLKYRSILLP
jgi:hypothetical protein